MEAFSFEFVNPWRGVSSENGAQLARELQLELSPGHPLYGLELIPIARSVRADDVLFRLPDSRVAAVHLTWKGGPEEPPWPSSVIYADQHEWAQNVMVLESLE